MSPEAANAPREVAVVTGASRGIGLATARALACRGLDVALLSRASSRLGEAAALVRAAGGGEALAVACDVAVAEDVDRAAREIEARLGVPRLVVNNAGIVVRARLLDTSVEDFDRTLAVNLRGPYLVARALLPGMLARGRGRLVQVSSISGTIGSPGAAAYAASKWGLLGLTKSLAAELRGTGVQVVAVAPGSVDTEMLVGSGFTPQLTADDVASAIVHAGLDAPAAVHGATIELFGDLLVD